MSILKSSSGGLLLGSAGGIALASSTNLWMTQMPALPAASKDITWEGAGDPTTSPVTDGTAGDWSDDGGTTTYPNLTDLAAAQTGDVTLNLPEGEFILTNEASNTTAYDIAYVGHANGTYLQGDVSGQNVFELNTSAVGSGNLFVKNVTVGAFDAAIAAFDFSTAGGNYGSLVKGAYGLRYSRGGNIYAENVTIRFVSYDGVSAGSTNESVGGSGSRDQSAMFLYNCHFYGNGGSSARHNMYIHGVPLYMYRCISHDAGGSHALKYDGEIVVLNECAIMGIYDPALYANSANALDVSWPSDIHCHNSIIASVTDGSDGQMISLAARSNAGGCGWSKRFPTWWEQDLTSGNSRNFQWKRGGSGATDELYGCRVSSYSSPDLTVKNVNQIGVDASSSINNVLTSNYWRIEMITSAGHEERTATKGDGTLVFTLSSAFSGTPAANALVVIYPDADGQDIPYLNREMWDKNDANYYWDKIRSGGNLDLTKYADIPMHLFQNTFFKRDDQGVNGRVFDWYASLGAFLFGSWSSSNLVETPEAPLSGEDSSGTWSDAAWGSIDFGGSQTIFTGDEPTTGDFVMPLIIGLAGSPLVDAGSASTQDGDVKPAGYSVETAGSPWPPNVNYIAGGSVNNVADPDTTGGNWWPTTAQTTINGALSAGVSTLVVDSITGFSDGQKIMIEYTPTAGQKQIHVTTISGAPSGSSIVLAAALERDVADGAYVAAIADHGSLPEWFVDIPEIWNNRRTV